MSTFEKQLVREAEEFLGIPHSAVKGTVAYVKEPYVPPVNHRRRRSLGMVAALAVFGAWDVAGVTLIILRRLGGHG